MPFLKEPIKRGEDIFLPIRRTERTLEVNSSVRLDYQFPIVCKIIDVKKMENIRK